MRYAMTLAALALTVTVSACGGGARQQEFTVADAQAIRQSTAALAAAVNEKQVEKAVEFYAENSVFMPPNAPMLRGRDPLKSFYGDLAAKDAMLEMQPDEVVGHGPLAFESGTYRLSYKGNGARDRGKYLRVLRNMSGTWRAEKTIWSSDLPPPSSGLADRSLNAER